MGEWGMGERLSLRPLLAVVSFPSAVGHSQKYELGHIKRRRTLVADWFQKNQVFRETFVTAFYRSFIHVQLMSTSK